MALHRNLLTVACLLILSACGGPPGLEDYEPGEVGRVVRVIDGDALVLDTGQSVRLVGVEAPSFGRDGNEDDAFAAEAHRTLEDLVLGRQVRLFYAGLTRDRYDRALAHVVTADRLGPHYWVNQELVSRGAVRVRVYPDTAKGSALLFQTERDARSAGSGLWALREYRVQDARDVDAGKPGFTILSGILGQRQSGPFDDTPCMRNLLGSRIAIVVDLSAMQACDLEDGLRIEVRGWYREGRLRLNAAENLRVQEQAAMAAR